MRPWVLLLLWSVASAYRARRIVRVHAPSTPWSRVLARLLDNEPVILVGAGAPLGDADWQGAAATGGGNRSGAAAGRRAVRHMTAALQRAWRGAWGGGGGPFDGALGFVPLALWMASEPATAIASSEPAAAAAASPAARPLLLGSAHVDMACAHFFAAQLRGRKHWSVLRPAAGGLRPLHSLFRAAREGELLGRPALRGDGVLLFRAEVAQGEVLLWPPWLPHSTAARGDSASLNGHVHLPAGLPLNLPPHLHRRCNEAGVVPPADDEGWELDEALIRTL